jgi:hypothetical protein
MPSFLPARTPIADRSTVAGRPVARATVLAALVAVPALAVAIAVGPALGANAATTTTAATGAGAHYTLSVTGNGTKALVFWSTARQGGATTGTTSGTPVTMLPWHRSVSAKADLYQVVAIQQHGTKLRCTIRNGAGKVVSSSYSLGRNAVVTCTLSKRNLFSLSSLG